MKYIGIIGSRSRDISLDLTKTWNKFIDVYKSGDIIVSGGCPKGGDRFAELIAKEQNIPIIIYPADWEKHGRAAGFIRNTDIADKSDVLIACVSDDRTGGTEDTIKKFQKLNKGEVHLV